ncbi:hypothetical protein IKF81_01140 [Candidatus Saccharibacteria bacterium]|nr:hypothetical protein [Candidatus Saccharibacteria bacterium]
MRLKQQTQTLILLGTILFLAVSGTVAYFVTTEIAHNIVSTKGVDIELYELVDPEGDGSSPAPFNDLEKIIPGITYSKIPYVENIDTEPVWTRAKLTLKRKIDDIEIIIDDPTSLIELGEMSEKWTLKEDGFYYYDSSLNGGKSTEPLFKTVKFKDGLDDEYNNATFTLTIDAEATQVANNGTTPTEANWTEGGGE